MDLQPAQPRLDGLGIGAVRGRAPDADVAIPDASDDVVVQKAVGGAGTGRKVDSHRVRTPGSKFGAISIDRQGGGDKPAPVGV